MDGPPARTGPPATEPLAGQIARAVTGCRDVAAMSSGPSGTYLPGGVVPGVVVGDGVVRVAVIARHGRPLVEVANEVRAAVRAVTPDRQVDVVIEDIDVPSAG